jgi:hypothetical protein
MTKQRCGKEVHLKYSSLVHRGNIALCANVSEARRKDMTKPALHEEQFCSRCNAWGPADLMQPLYRFPDQDAAPWLWMHHHCAEICSTTQFQAAMKRFETQVHSMTAGGVVDIAKARARVNLAAAADRAARSLQALKRARATLEIANIDPDGAVQTQPARNQEPTEDDASRDRASPSRDGSDQLDASAKNKWRRHLRWIKHCRLG